MHAFVSLVLATGLVSSVCPPSSALAFSKKAPPPAPTDASLTQPSDTEEVWVGKDDEAKSCAKDRGIPLETMETILSGAGIKVLARRKVPDGMARIQMCGADKGEMNGYQISRKDLDKAKNLGFKPVAYGNQ